MPQDDHVPGGAVRVIELVGSSPNSFSDAVRNAVRLASQSLPTSAGWRSSPATPTWTTPGT